MTLYAFGFAESLQIVCPGVPIQVVPAVTIAALTPISTKGAKIALKLHISTMRAIGLSLPFLVAGSSVQGKTHLFWRVFTVFLREVPEITAGVALFGGLKHPQRSVPFDTIAAITICVIVYPPAPIVLAFSAHMDVL